LIGAQRAHLSHIADHAPSYGAKQETRVLCRALRQHHQ
jgi:hypothetical protein